MNQVANKIQEVLKTSKQVINDCIVENGAVVAANTDKAYFSKGVENYRYVWVRDGSFILYAAYLLGNSQASVDFSHWLLERAEGFEDRGLVFRRYGTHGNASFRYAHEYQPDQTGELLWLLTSIPETSLAPVEKAVHLAATNLSASWQGTRFKVQTYDIWEQRRTSPRRKVAFTYTLACCSLGLKRAYETYGNKHWLEVSQQMRSVVENRTGKSYYPRLTAGRLKQIDASMLGLIWPFATTSDRARQLLTLQKIEEDLAVDGGIVRYRGDRYDGRIKATKYLMEGAGTWPLLSCWLSLAYNELGDKEKARVIFEDLTLKLPNNYIPEQLFDDGRVGISPLGWSHAMYVIAAHSLGYTTNTMV